MSNSTARVAQTAPGSTRLHSERIAVVLRVLIGALFIYMGLRKALDPVDFLKLVRQYDLTSNPYLLNTIAAGLPWFEVYCGLLLVTGIAVRGTALLMAGMLIPFTGVVLHRGMNLASAQDIALCAVRFDCGCGAGEVNLCAKILENSLLVLASLWFLYTGRGRTASVWSRSNSG